MKRNPLWIVTLQLLLAATLACSGLTPAAPTSTLATLVATTPGAATVTPPPPTRSAPDASGVTGLREASITDLVDDLTRDGSLAATVAAAQEVLARGGLAIVSPAAEAGATGVNVLVAAYPPESPMRVALPEVLSLALETRLRATTGRASVEELAQMMAGLGWPFHPEPSPGEQVMDFLSLWVQQAQQQPNAPDAFVPLFLAEMARRQSPAVDLAAGDSSPAEAWLSLLELQLLSAAFDRHLAASVAVGPASAHAATGGHLAAVVYQSDPCSQYRHTLYGPWHNLVLPDDLARELGDVGLTTGVGQLITEALEAVGVDPEGVEDFNKAMGITAILARLWKLALLYKTLAIRVRVEGDNPVHKLLETEADLLKAFYAETGVSDDDWQEYQEKYGEIERNAQGIIRDCLSVLGLPHFVDSSEIAQAVEGWAVEWRIDRKAEKHLDWSPDHQIGPGSKHLGYWRSILQRSSDHAAQASFVARVLPEREANHPGILHEFPARVCAEVDASEAPSLSTFVSGAQGGVGLADSIVELAAGVLQKLAKPTGCATLFVTFHQPFRLAISTRTIGDFSEGGVHIHLESSGASEVALTTTDAHAFVGQGEHEREYTQTLTSEAATCQLGATEVWLWKVAGHTDDEAGEVFLKLNYASAGVTANGSCTSEQGTVNLSYVVPPSDSSESDSEAVTGFRMPLRAGETRVFSIEVDGLVSTLTITIVADEG